MFSLKKKKEESDTEVKDVRLLKSEVKEILRTVPRDKAFYFYESLGKPTGHVATSLVDFRNKVNTVPSSCLAFHLRRKDFENWVRDVMGDSELAKRISEIDSSGFYVRMKLYAVVDTRINELQEMLSTSSVVSEDVFASSRLSEAE